MEEKGLEEKKRLDLKKIMGQLMHTKPLLVICMIGVLLLVASGGLSGKKAGGSKPAQETPAAGTASYSRQLEERLCSILTDIEGVGAVNVMITLEDNGQNVLAYDEKYQAKAVSGQPASAGTAQGDKQTDSKLVLRTEQGGSQTPVTVKEILPQVAGVLVVAEGGGNPAVKNDIISAVRAVTNVKAHKVCVVSQRSEAQANEASK